MLSTSRPQESAGASQLRNPRREPPPVRTFELVRAKFDKVLEINALKQTFFADIFFEFKIRGGALDEDLSREGDGPPSTHFPKDTLRPSARWYLCVPTPCLLHAARHATPILPTRQQS